MLSLQVREQPVVEVLDMKNKANKSVVGERMLNAWNQ